MTPATLDLSLLTGKADTHFPVLKTEASVSIQIKRSIHLSPLYLQIWNLFQRNLPICVLTEQYVYSAQMTNRKTNKII